MRDFRKGFTLMEVNLAVFIMAVGVLGMVALYPLGFRESQQSQDAVSGSALADAVLNPMVAALSATNITWTSWRQAVGGGTPGLSSIQPADGWRAYCKDRNSFIPNKKTSIQTLALSTASTLLGKLQTVQGTQNGGANAQNVLRTCAEAFRSQQNLQFALVARYGTLTRWENGEEVEVVDPSRICLCLRTFRRGASLFSEPVYCTEVHFQGDPSK